jgi:hypothetical protein
MANDFADVCAAAIQDAIAAALRDEGETLSSDVRSRISVPVEKSGGKIIRSKPGEPPRKDTGRLHAEINTQTIVAGDVAEMAVESPTPYAPPLNNELNRPIYGLLLDESADRIVNACASKVDGINLSGD